MRHDGQAHACSVKCAVCPHLWLPESLERIKGQRREIGVWIVHPTNDKEGIVRGSSPPAGVSRASIPQ